MLVGSTTGRGGTKQSHDQILENKEEKADSCKWEKGLSAS